MVMQEWQEHVARLGLLDWIEVDRNEKVVMCDGYYLYYLLEAFQDAHNHIINRDRYQWNKRGWWDHLDKPSVRRELSPPLVCIASQWELDTHRQRPLTREELQTMMRFYGKPEEWPLQRSEPYHPHHLPSEGWIAPRERGVVLPPSWISKPRSIEDAERLYWDMESGFGLEDAVQVPSFTVT
jgi:hypothetical protein